MPSTLMVGFEQRLRDLESCFIVQRNDYSAYTSDDHMKALAYRLLASAALENFVEARCLEVASFGCDRLSKSQPTATGRALVLWMETVDRWAPASQMLIHESDPLALAHTSTAIFEAYAKFVKRSHGIAGADLRGLVFPLGLRSSQVPEVLTSSMDALAQKRNPASHTYINRAKSLTEPAEEVTSLAQILAPLRQLDDDLSVVCDAFPVNHL